jgi:SAM-dependent methyltransferase
LRSINPVDLLQAGVETWTRIREAGSDPTGKVFLEVGTGRAPIVPMAYWLMGAKGCITIDLNRYMKGELIRESVAYLADNLMEITTLFGPYLDTQRLDDLLRCHASTGYSTEGFLELCGIRYIAPGDAASTGLEAGSIDFHTSYNVLEHIPMEVLREILHEGTRILRPGGLFVHRVDYSDHFSHSDRSISAINFLQYSDDEWKGYAGNRYMYMNRLRHDDFVSLFETAGLSTLLDMPHTNERVLALLRSGAFPLHTRYQDKSEAMLAITGAWIVSQPQA